MQTSGVDIRAGTVVRHADRLWITVDAQAVKSETGEAVKQVELADLLNGDIMNTRFFASQTVEQVDLDRRDHQFLFESGDMLTFMDLNSYDRIRLRKDFIGRRAAFLRDGMQVAVEFHGDRPLGIALPDQMVLEIREIEANDAFDAANEAPDEAMKLALLENGLKVKVPAGLSRGEKIVVDTSEIAYIRRAG